jgi:hypothetical protein
MAPPQVAMTAVGIRALPPFEQPLVSVGSSEYNSAASSPRGGQPGTAGEQAHPNGELTRELQALGNCGARHSQSNAIVRILEPSTSCRSCM